MGRRWTGWVMWVVAIGVAGDTQLLGQTGNQEEGRPVASSACGMLPSCPVATVGPVWPMPPPPPPFPPFPVEQPCGPAPDEGCYLENPWEPAGWIGSLQVGLIKPHVKSRLVSAGPVAPAFTEPVHLPVAPLNWTPVPRLDMAYRFSQGVGELHLACEQVASSGSTGFLHSRLDMSVIDFDYMASEFHFDQIPNALPRNLRLGLGTRLVNAFFDSRYTGWPVLEEHVNSSFFGAGPRGIVELYQPVPRWRLDLFARLEATGVWGGIRQHFGETTLVDGGPVSGELGTGQKTIGMGILTVISGISWVPPWAEGRLRVSCGYQWERWWDFGRTDESNAELTLQGVVFKGEWHF